MDRHRVYGSRDSDLNVSLNLSDIEDSSRQYQTDSLLTGEESELRDINENSSFEVDGDSDDDHNPYKSYQQFYIDVSQSVHIGDEDTEDIDEQTRSLHEFEALEHDAMEGRVGHQQQSDLYSDEPLATYLISPRQQKRHHPHGHQMQNGGRHQEHKGMVSEPPQPYEAAVNGKDDTSSISYGSGSQVGVRSSSRQRSQLPILDRSSPLPKKPLQRPSSLSQRSTTPSRIPLFKSPASSPAPRGPLITNQGSSSGYPSMRSSSGHINYRRQESPSPERSRASPQKHLSRVDTNQGARRPQKLNLSSGRGRESSMSPRSPVTPSVTTKIPTPVRRSPSVSPTTSLVRSSGGRLQRQESYGKASPSKIPRLPSPLLSKSVSSKRPATHSSIPNKLPSSAPVSVWNIADDRTSPSRLPMFFKGNATPIRKPVPVTPKQTLGGPVFNFLGNYGAPEHPAAYNDTPDNPEALQQEPENYPPEPESPVSPSSSVRDRYLDTQDQVTWEGTSDVEMKPWSEDPSALPNSPPPKPHYQMRESELLSGMLPMGTAKESSVDTPISVIKGQFDRFSEKPAVNQEQPQLNQHRQRAVEQRYEESIEEDQDEDDYSSAKRTSQPTPIQKFTRALQDIPAMVPAAMMRKRTMTMGSEHPEDVLQQLQLEYDELLEKYALAENTIDQLRLGAHLRLFTTTTNRGIPGEETSTLSTPVVASANQNGISGNKDSASPLNGHEFGEGDLGKKSPEQVTLLGLTFRAKNLADEVHSFETLLAEGEDHLSPPEQEAIFGNLKKSFDKLQKDYMTAKETFRHSMPNGEQFDGDRALEGELFKLGLKVDEVQAVCETAAQSHINSNRVPYLASSVKQPDEHSRPSHPSQGPTEGDDSRKLARKLRKLKKMPKTRERDKAVQEVVQAMQRMNVVDGLGPSDMDTLGDSSVSEDGVTVIDNLTSTKSDRERHGSYSSAYSGTSVRSSTLERKTRRLQDSDSGFIGSEGSRQASSMEKLGGPGMAGRRPPGTQLSAIQSETSQAGDDTTDQGRTAQWATRQKNHFGPVLPNRGSMPSLGPSQSMTDGRVTPDGSHLSRQAPSTSSSKRARLRDLQNEVASLRHQVAASVSPLDLSPIYSARSPRSRPAHTSSPFSAEPSPRKRVPYHQPQSAHELDLSDSDNMDQQQPSRVKGRNGHSNQAASPGFKQSIPSHRNRGALSNKKARGGLTMEKSTDDDYAQLSIDEDGFPVAGTESGHQNSKGNRRRVSSTDPQRPSKSSDYVRQWIEPDAYGRSQSHGAEGSRHQRKGYRHREDNPGTTEYSTQGRYGDQYGSYRPQSPSEVRGHRYGEYQEEPTQHRSHSSHHEGYQNRPYPDGSHHPHYPGNTSRNRRSQSSLGLPNKGHFQGSYDPAQNDVADPLSMGDLGHTYSRSLHNLAHTPGERPHSPYRYSNGERPHSPYRYSNGQRHLPSDGRHYNQPGGIPFSQPYAAPHQYAAPPHSYTAPSGPVPSFSGPQHGSAFQRVRSVQPCGTCAGSGYHQHSMPAPCPTCGTGWSALPRTASEPHIAGAVTPVMTHIQHSMVETPIAVPAYDSDQSFLTRSLDTGKTYVTQPIQLESAHRSGQRTGGKGVRFYIREYADGDLVSSRRSKDVLVQAKQIYVSESDDEELRSSIGRAKKAVRKLRSQSMRIRNTLNGNLMLS